MLGDEGIRRGWMVLKPVTTEACALVSNDAVVPAGTSIPTDSLIGIKSKPPVNGAISAGESWFGTPPIKLPARPRFDGVGANWTYEPSKSHLCWNGC